MSRGVERERVRDEVVVTAPPDPDSRPSSRTSEAGAGWDDRQPVDPKIGELLARRWKPRFDLEGDQQFSFLLLGDPGEPTNRSMRW